MDNDDRHEDQAHGSAAAWQPIPPARSHCGYWLKRAERGFAKNVGRLLNQCGILPSEWTALRTLYGPQWRSPMELGRLIGMSKGGASKLVSRLVKKGLMQKCQNDFDRRFRSIALTRQGREFVVRLAAVEKDTDREFFEPLGNNHKYRLKQCMARVLDARHLQRMDERMSARIQQHGILRLDPNAGARAAAQAQAEAEALWNYINRAGELAAYGTHEYSIHGSLR
jgi:DNA-binding MarR family transcriptional regulator